jgi:hypothetical protein
MHCRYGLFQIKDDVSAVMARAFLWLLTTVGHWPTSSVAYRAIAGQLKLGRLVDEGLPCT